MKRTCGGCKALEATGRNSYSCVLGYETKTTYNEKTGSWIDTKPLEECPKPKSTKQLFELLKLKK